MFPYNSPDCKSLHNGFALALKRNFSKVKFIRSGFSKINIFDYLIQDVNGHYFNDFQEKLKKECIYQGLDQYYYGILDSIIKSINWRLFFRKISLKKSFFLKLKEVEKEIEDSLTKNNDICILSDSAYLENQILKFLFLKNKKKVYYLNPTGNFFQYKNNYYSEFSSKIIEDSKIEINNNQISNYLKKRFSGKSNSDFDSSLSFYNELQYKSKRKKVLFLHAFRDANNITWSTNQPFNSYFEWVYYTLKVIRDNDEFDNWYIKPHPSGSFYKNDSDILKRLIRTFNVPDSCVTNCPNTKYILENKFPIFSNNGTIILESACYGFGSFYCGSRFNMNFGFYASSKESWKKFLLQPIPKAENLKISKDKSQVAKWNIFMQFNYKNIRPLVSNRPIFPNESKRNKLLILFSQFNNLLNEKWDFNN